MMSTMPPQDDDRHQRLAAIAQLEQQHKMRRSNMEQEGQIDPSSPRMGRYFVLLVSKGSGNLQQRANQDRAETMLNGLPHDILDGSNFALSAKRDDLFEISQVRGNYPQLFLVDNGVTNFVGGFDVIEFHNEGGTLKSLLEGQLKSPKKKTSIVGAVKGLLKNGSKKDASHTAEEAKSSNHTNATDPLSQRSTSLTSHMSKRSVLTDGSGTPAPVQEKPDPVSLGSKKPKDKRGRRASMELGPRSSPHSLEDDTKPASTGRLMVSKSDGDKPLIDEEDQEKKPKGEGRSRSKSRSKDMKRSSSKGKHRAKEGEQALKDEGGDEEMSSKKGSKSSSKSGRSRSTSAGKYKEKREKKENKEGKDHENKEKSKSSRRPSRSRGRLRESVKSAKEDKETEDKQGEMDLKEEGDDKKSSKTRSSRSKSRSKRDLRTTESEGKEGEASADDDKVTKTRKPRNRRELIAKEGDDEVEDEGKPGKPKSRTKLRDKNPEKHPRRNSMRSASPHKLRDKTKRSESIRSTSPGKFRGDIARKREAMKEFREKKSFKNIDDDESRVSETGSRRLQRHQSVKQIEISSSSLLSTPKRHKSLNHFNKKGKGSDQIDESLHDLVMRVKEKEKKAKGNDDDDTSNAGSAVPSVQW